MGPGDLDGGVQVEAAPTGLRLQPCLLQAPTDVRHTLGHHFGPQGLLILIAA